jgi:hypothetical protein
LSFADATSGTDAQPGDWVLANLSKLAEEEKGIGVDHTPTMTFAEWRPLSADEFTKLGLSQDLLYDTHSHFKAIVYTNGQGDYVVAFGGTKTLYDWLENARQNLFALTTAQYQEARSLAKMLQNKLGSSVVFTGHSLGGGLASYAALATDLPAVTFNAAGLSDHSVQLLGYADRTEANGAAEVGLIRAYHVDGELLTFAQDADILTKIFLPPILNRTNLPSAVGKKITITDPHPVPWYKVWIPGVEFRHRLDEHGMDYVLDALQENLPW